METLLLNALPLYGHIRWKRKFNINISSLQVMSYIFFFIKHNTPASCFTIFITSLCPHQPWKPALDLLRGLITAIERVVIHSHEEPKPLKNLDSQVCEICGHEIGLTVDGDLFLAFPVCRPCYEYERREGTQVCPQCWTTDKRLKGSPRVEGDDDEEVIDDIEHEFNIDEKKNKNKQVHVADMLHGKMSYGRGPETDENFSFL